MADFHTHVTVSSVLGCGYSVAGMAAGMPPSTALVAGGLCGISGMLPDVDSDSGIPRRETMGFAAAIVPMLLVDRFRQMGMAHDHMVLAAAVLYFIIRFTAAKMIGKWSVHRGMWHSIPAVLIFAGIAFLIAGPADNLTVRYFKAFAVGLGAFSHLILDEIYSVDTRGVVPKFKKSFGTAVKLWGKSGWANFSTYAKLLVVVAAIVAEPSVMARIEEAHPEFADRVKSYGDRFSGLAPRNVQQPAPSPALPSPGPALPPPQEGQAVFGVPGNYRSAPAQPNYAPAQANYAPAQPNYASPQPNYAPANPYYAAPPSSSPWGQPAPGYAPTNQPVQPFSAQAPIQPPAIRRQ